MNTRKQSLTDFKIHLLICELVNTISLQKFGARSSIQYGGFAKSNTRMAV